MVKGDNNQNNWQLLMNYMHCMCNLIQAHHSYMYVFWIVSLFSS